jgi:hypothetical protein
MPDDVLLSLHKSLVEKIADKGPFAIGKRLVAGSATSGSSTYDFECTLGQVAEAMAAQFQRRGIPIPGVSTAAQPNRSIQVNMTPRC